MEALHFFGFAEVCCSRVEKSQQWGNESAPKLAENKSQLLAMKKAPAI